MNLGEHRKAKQIVILCEGDTEVTAVKEFIRRQWIEDGLESVGLLTKDLKGKLEGVHIQTRLYHKNLKVVAVFTLVDTREFNVVDLSRYDSLTKKTNAAKRWLKNDFEKEIPEKFYPHLSVHETEAWILADGVALANRLKNNRLKPRKNAEKLDDHNPPKKRLNELFRKHKQYEYHEIKEGTPLFKRLNFEKVYDSCPNFKKFYDDLKAVAQSLI